MISLKPQQRFNSVIQFPTKFHGNSTDRNSFQIIAMRTATFRTHYIRTYL